jgi:hypothetical protein
VIVLHSEFFGYDDAIDTTLPTFDPTAERERLSRVTRKGAIAGHNAEIAARRQAERARRAETGPSPAERISESLRDAGFASVEVGEEDLIGVETDEGREALRATLMQERLVAALDVYVDTVATHIAEPSKFYYLTEDPALVVPRELSKNGHLRMEDPVLGVHCFAEIPSNLRNVPDAWRSLGVAALQERTQATLAAYGDVLREANPDLNLGDPKAVKADLLDYLGDKLPEALQEGLYPLYEEALE